MVAMTATYPLVGISTRAAVESSKNPEEPMVKAALKILQQEGVSGLYAGLSSSLIGIGVTNLYVLCPPQSLDTTRNEC
jgi:adenine nucleotide transporter 17